MHCGVCRYLKMNGETVQCDVAQKFEYISRQKAKYEKDGGM